MGKTYIHSMTFIVSPKINKLKTVFIYVKSSSLSQKSSIARLQYDVVRLQRVKVIVSCEKVSLHRGKVSVTLCG